MPDFRVVPHSTLFWPCFSVREDKKIDRGSDAIAIGSGKKVPLQHMSVLLGLHDPNGHLGPQSSTGT